MSMSSKTAPFSLELFSFVKQLAGLIEEHLDLGLTYHGLTGLRSNYLHKFPTLVGLKRLFKTVKLR